MPLLIGLCLGLSLSLAEAQVVKDPLLDYYLRISKPGFYPACGDPNFHYSSQTQVYFLEADFTDSKRKSVFITDEGEYLGAHGNFGWSIYCPVESGGYHLVTDESTLIAAGPDGPEYIGYIDQIKSYGVIIGEKHSVTAYYLENGVIQSEDIDQQRGHANAEHYPKYFHDKPVSYHKTTYTLAQLAQKYPNPDANNVVTPAAK